jgi:hypothetical protein
MDLYYFLSGKQMGRLGTQHSTATAPCHEAGDGAPHRVCSPCLASSAISSTRGIQYLVGHPGAAAPPNLQAPEFLHKHSFGQLRGSLWT